MEPISIEFLSQGVCVHGRFYTAVGTDEPATLLFVPGWPGVPEDFLGLGPLLSQQGVNWLEFYSRGIHPREGVYCPTNAPQEITAALHWLRQADVQVRFKVDPSRFVLAGYSNGGGLAMAYAAGDPGVRRIISFAGNDFGEFTRQMQRDPIFAEGIRGWLLSTHIPQGPASFDMEANLQEFIDHLDIFGLRENAARLADRSILIFGGWEDQGPTIDHYQLPLYRSLKAAGAADVTFIVYHTDHSFNNVLQRLVTDIADWILKE